jgi:SET domain-containing protein
MFEVRASAIDGQGAFALRRIRKRTRIVEYTGERITPADADARYDDDGDDNHTYLFTVDKRTVIDATHTGSDARFINHSCEPNCEAIDDGGRIFIEALRDIAPGEELFYDYGYELDEPLTPALRKQYPCYCGTEHCRGTILAVDA